MGMGWRATAPMAQQSMQIDGDKGDAMFDPTKFGGRPASEVHMHGSHSRGRGADACYAMTKKRQSSERRLVKLVIPPDVTDELIRSTGIRDRKACICPVEGDGSILLWAVDDSGYPVRTLSKCGKGGTSTVVSVESMTDALIERFGKFEHIYLDAMPVDGGRAYKLTPNGRRD